MSISLPKFESKAQFAAHIATYTKGVFRLANNSKKPPAKYKWADEATTDPDEDLTANNYGVAMGGGVFVLDVDTKKGDGFDELEDLERVHGNGHTLPPTLTVFTPSGGAHYYFAYDPEAHDVRNNQGKLGDNLDIRGDGGYVVGPWSQLFEEKVEGFVTYDLDQDDSTDIAVAPDWLIRLIVGESEPTNKSRPKKQNHIMHSDFDFECLAYFDVDKYDDWCKVGMALRESFGESGFTVWADWSDTGGAPDDRETMRKKWDSFNQPHKEKKVTATWLYATAKRKGWQAGRSRAEHMQEIEGAIKIIDDLEAGVEQDETLLINVAVRLLGVYFGSGMWPTQYGATKAPADARNTAYVLQKCRLETRYSVFGDRDVEFVAEDEQVMRLATLRPEVIMAAIESQALNGNLKEGLRAMIYERAMKGTLYNPFEEWARQTDWDGKDRIDAVVELLDLKDEADAAIAEMYVERWLVSVAAMASNHKSAPQGCRGILVLSGPQSSGKTSFFRSLVPPGFYTEGASLNFNGMNKADNIRQATRTPITELGEIETTFRKSDIGALKNFLTSSTDIYRIPYGRTEIAMPRRTAFCGTVNTVEFIRDDTGGDRFWPLEVNSVNWVHDIDLAQLWAQVFKMYDEGHSWHLNDRETGHHRDHVDKFRERSEGEQLVMDEIHSVPYRGYGLFTLSKVVQALGLQSSPRNLGAVKAALGTLGYNFAANVKGAKRESYARNVWCLPVTEALEHVKFKPCTPGGGVPK